MEITYSAWKKTLSEVFSKNSFPQLLIWGAVQLGIVKFFLMLMEVKDTSFWLIMLEFFALILFYSILAIPLHIAVKNHYIQKNTFAVNMKATIQSFQKIFGRFVPFAVTIILLCLFPIILYFVCLYLSISVFNIIEMVRFELFLVPETFLKYLISFVVPLFVTLYLSLRFLFSFAYFFEFYETKTNKEMMYESWNCSKGKLNSMFFFLLGYGLVYSFIAMILEYFAIDIVVGFVFFGINTVLFYVLYNEMKCEKNVVLQKKYLDFL